MSEENELLDEFKAKYKGLLNLVRVTYPFKEEDEILFTTYSLVKDIKESYKNAPLPGFEEMHLETAIEDNFTKYGITEKVALKNFKRLFDE